MGKGDDFSATIAVTEDMKNEYNEILLPFSDFSPAITAENAVGLDKFTFATEGCSTKSTVKLESIHAYKVDDGVNYYDALGLAYGKDAYEYTADSFAAFKASFDALKVAQTREDRYAAKVDVIAKIDALVPVPLVAEDFGLIAANAEDVGVSIAATALTDGALDVLCGNSDSKIVSKSIEASRAWTQCTVNFNSKSYTEVYIDFACGGSPDGSAIIIDDLSIDAGGNLIANPGFEDVSVEPWLIYNGTSLTDEAHGGSRALCLFANASEAKAARQTAIAVEPGTDYSLTFWAKADENSTGTKPYVCTVYGGSANAAVTFDTIPEKSGSYDAIRFSLSSLYPDYTSGDFAVRLTVSTAGGDVTSTVERSLISAGNYCFALPAAVSEITQIKVEFINASVGAVVRIEGVDLVSASRAKSAKAAIPSALAILRATVGLGTVENGDLNGDGSVDIADALLALRAEAGLA